MTAKTLFQAATVNTGDGTWNRGVETESETAGAAHTLLAGICDPATFPQPQEVSTVRDVAPFSIYVARKFNRRCAPADAVPTTRLILEDSTEYHVARVLWDGGGAITAGTWTSDVWLSSPDVTTVASNVDPMVTLADVLAKFEQDNPQAKPLLHLGRVSAQKLATALPALGLDWIVGPGYPNVGIAATGPITINLGDVSSVQADVLRAAANNRYVVEATRMASIEFDVELAVRAA